MGLSVLNLAEYAEQHLKKVASTHGGEWHGACPKCGGNDRFVMQPFRKKIERSVGYYFCRKCKPLGGDAISFEIDMLGRDPKEVLGNTKKEHRPLSFFDLVKKPKSRTFTPQKSELPADKWLSKSAKFVDWAHKNLLHNQEGLKKLELRGIPYEAIIKFKLGWNPQDAWRNKIDWGIEQNENDKKLWLAKGIVIPNIRHDDVLRINVRRTDWKEDDLFGKYIKVSGGKKGYNIYGNTNNNVMVITESELDAIAAIHAAGDFLFAVAISSNVSDPDLLTDHLAKNKYVLISHDNDEGGAEMLSKLLMLYPHAQACPVPIFKDIGEAVQLQLDFNLREWLLSKIPFTLHPIITPPKSNVVSDFEAQPIETIREPEKENVVEVLRDEINVAPASIKKILKTADEWVYSDRPLIEWWLNLDRSTLPQSKFYLSLVEPVKNPESFYREIDIEINAGPKGEAARSGSLQGKLIKVKRHMDKT